MRKIIVVVALVAAVVVAGLLIGVTASKLMNSGNTAEKYSHPVNSGDPTGVFEVASDTVKITFDASAELQSIIPAMQSILAPQSIDLQFGQARIMVDGPIPEITVLFITLIVGIAIWWKVRR